MLLPDKDDTPFLTVNVQLLIVRSVSHHLQYIGLQYGVKVYGCRVVQLMNF